MTTQTRNADLASSIKKVLRFLPAPVGIVSSFAADTGQPIGLAMSAIMPISLEPCSMAISVNRSGSAHAGILASGKFCINLLTSDPRDHMAPFASADLRDQRFTQPDWQQHGHVWYIAGAPASIFCEVRETLSFGTHDLLIGVVYDLIATGREDILGWANGALGQMVPLH